MKPPQRWLHLLERASHPQDRAWVAADAVEGYREIAAEKGKREADRWMRSQALRAILPGISERWRRRGRPRVDGGATSVSGGLFGLLDDARRDAQHAVRSLRRSPALVVLVVGSLAVGIGGTTVVFSLARSLLFPDPGPMQNPEGIVTVYESAPSGEAWQQVAFPNYLEMKQAVPAFSDIAALRIGVVRLGESTDGERMIVELVTGNYFDVLGLQTTLGRSFASAETQLGSAQAQFIMSYEFWQRRFGGSPDVLGQTVLLDGQPHTVIGVGPRRLSSRLLQMRVNGWIPLGIPGGTYNATEQELSNRSDQEYLVLGRLAGGASLAQVTGQLDSYAEGVAERFPEMWQDDRGEARFFSALPESESRLPPDFRVVAALLFGLLLVGTGLILAIACTNVAGLLLARAQRRAGEVSIRVSIGAGRGRIIRMLMTESLLLAGLGGALGVVLSWLVVRRGASLPLPGTLPDLAFDLSVDLPVLFFSVLTATTCALLFGLAPALQAARNEGSLSSGMRGGSRGSRGRRILVSLQVAGSVIFLVSAGLLARSVGASVADDPGLETSHLALVNIARDTDEDPAAWLSGLESDLRREGLTEVAFASAVEVSPFWDMTNARILIPGHDEGVVVPFNSVTANYGSLVDLDMRRGRWLNESDRAGGVPAVVVNERFVDAYFPEGDPVGRTFAIEEQRNLSTPVRGPEITVQVVGVAANVQNTPIGAPSPYFWSAMDQMPVAVVMVHAVGSTPAEAAAALARVTAGEVTIVGPSTYQELVDTNTLGQKAIAGLLGSGAVFALLLAVIGLGGLLSVSVAMRLQELSIRQALGATRSDVIREVLGESGRLAGIGIAIGLAIAIPGALLSRSVLPGVSPLDPLTLLGTVGLLGACALLTALPPALRAANADPLRHLRGE